MSRVALVDASVRPHLSSNPENAAKGFLLSGDYWGANLDKVTERWNEWRLS
jgi:putative spermidine/putrescine transport system substrate-binding protein